MKHPSVLAVLALFLAPVARSVSAQTTTEITVKVPVILTQLAPDVQSVRVTCNIISSVLTNATNGNQLTRPGEDIPVTGGEVVKLVTIVFSVALQNPAGQPASVGCWLQGWSASEQKFNYFNEAATNPAFRTKPSVATIQSSWVW